MYPVEAKGFAASYCVSYTIMHTQSGNELSETTYDRVICLIVFLHIQKYLEHAVFLYNVICDCPRHCYTFCCY